MAVLTRHVLITKKSFREETSRMKHRTWGLVLFQGGLVLGSLLSAWTLRFEFSLPNRGLLFSGAPILLIFRLAAMSRFGLFHGYWRYTSLRDAEDILKSVGLGSLGFVVATRFVLHLSGFPSSIYVLEALLTAGLLGGARLLCRALLQHGEGVRRRQR